MRSAVSTTALGVLLLLPLTALLPRSRHSASARQRSDCAGLFVQSSPGTVPEPFAPTNAGGLRFARTPIFSADCRELLWSADVGRFRSVIVRTRWADGEWTPAETLAFSTGAFFDHSPAVSADGRRMIFASNRPIPGKPASTIPGTEVPTSDLFLVERTAQGWATPQPLDSAINTAADEDAPALTRDGTLYFSSSRSGGGGGAGGIFRARRLGGRFAPPELLPPPITSGAGELLEYVAPGQEYLIFHSMAAGARSGLLVAFRSGHGGWDQPVPMDQAVRRLRGYRVTVTPDGRWLLFTARTPAGALVYWMDAGVLERLRATPGGAVPPGEEQHRE